MKIRIILLQLFLAGSLLAEWHKVEGNYSYVEYQPQLSATADSILVIAEKSIPEFCARVELSLELFENKKVRIILTDEPDVSNGYAIGNDIIIYAQSSQYVPGWTTSATWYETVVRHELVHHVIFRKTRRKSGFFGVLTDLSVSRWFHEGMAQYYAEDWNTLRGDLYLQSALLDGKLNFQSLYNLNDGLLLYSTGHAFVRYLAATYGDSSFIKLMSHNQDDWQFDFNAAFKAVYKKNVKEMFQDFYRHMVIYYGDKLADYPELSFIDKLPSYGKQPFQIIPLNYADSTYLSFAQLSAIHNYGVALIFQVKNGKAKVLETITNHIHTPLVIDDKQDFIAWGRTNIDAKNDQINLSHRWFIYNLKEHSTIELPRPLRSRYACFDAGQNLILSEVFHDKSIILKYSPAHNQLTELYKTEWPVGSCQTLKNGNIIFEAQRKNGQRDLFLLEHNSVRELTNDSHNNSSPIVINDTLFVFSRVERDRPVIALYNLNRDTFEVKIDSDNSLLPWNYDLSNHALIVNEINRYNAINLKSIPLDSLINRKVIPEKVDIAPRYTKWSEIRPSVDGVQNPHHQVLNKENFQREKITFPQRKLTHGLSLGLPLYDSDLGWGLYATSIWIESLNRQTIQANAVLFEEGWNKSFFNIIHILSYFNLYQELLYYHGPAVFSIEGGKRIDTYQDIAHIGFYKNYFIKGSSRSVITPFLDYNYYYYRINEQGDNWPKSYDYSGPSACISYRYLLPTLYYPVLPKRLLYADIRYFKSMSKTYDFNVRQFNLNIASNLLLENIGFMTRSSYISSAGTPPPLNRIGIDRFYEFDTPRDVTYTRSVRGVKQDLLSDELLWVSNELNLLLTNRSPMKLLFIPLNTIVFSGFYDYANLLNDRKTEVSGYGVELNFVWSMLKLGGGYAIGKLSDGKENKEFYWRIGIMMPGSTF
ncbi:MAG: hypothetical protein JXR46_05565 [Calditrichaceae bacterium]|nr:hypothetical protein [Calditrichaceae bacterium]MBN2708494.1 hypothetical protein [Calditrichaceae bacterium]RQV91964.1 MAG: hypothetical protein EH224_16910 [Calditrichota bacterium]